MRVRPGNIRNGNRGFSLVELLLTLVLILCLAAASVFTFTAIYKSANLDEGSDRFQSLIRFAQAEAATTGRKVRLQFVPNVSNENQSSEALTELRTVKVTWEADLLNAPGVFQEFTNKAWSEEIVNELVGVQKVAPISLAETAQTGAVSEPVPSEGEEKVDEFPPITFYPDGSCDSAEIVLASRNADDERRLAVRLEGMLGTVTTRTVAASEQDGGDSDANAEEFDEFNELFETGSPAETSAPASPYGQ